MKDHIIALRQLLKIFLKNTRNLTERLIIYVGRNACKALFAYADGIENGKYVFMPFCNKRGRTYYLYRPSKLKKDLNSKQATDILEKMGYCCENVNLCIVSLMKKLQTNNDFPHEIGLFLGYPPEDVCGFIKNKGCGCKCVGCWKVYGDENKAKQTFDKYKRCTELCCSLVEKGYRIENFAVSC